MTRPPRVDVFDIVVLAMRCPTCGQENLKAALVCEFCKELLVRKVPPQRADAPRPSQAQGWSHAAVAAVAVVCAGLGFGARSVWNPAAQAPIHSEPSAVVALPSAAPVALPAPAKTAVVAPPAKPAEPVAMKAAEAPAEPLPTPVETVDSSAGSDAGALKRITIPYQHREGFAQRVIIPVTLNGRLTVPMAVDTGAPGTILSTALATKLGVLSSGQNRLQTVAAGIGGSTSATLVVLDSLAVGEASTEFVPATVTDSLSDSWEGLLGMDFLAGYSVTIDSSTHQLVLTEQPPQQSAPAGHDEAWWRATFHQFSGQRNLWKGVLVRLAERAGKAEVSAGGESETLAQLQSFAQAQDREAEALLNRLDRYAAAHSVPLEWRRY